MKTHRTKRIKLILRQGTDIHPVLGVRQCTCDQEFQLDHTHEALSDMNEEDCLTRLTIFPKSFPPQESAKYNYRTCELGNDNTAKERQNKDEPSAQNLSIIFRKSERYHR